MARIYPNHLHVDTRSNAEKILYEQFQKNLPDDYVVFHSVTWLARSTRSGAQDGEADFIIVHPTHGLLVLEVKGGNIRYDGTAGQWYSHHFKIKDPFEQAKRNKYNLLEKLRDVPYWRNRWLAIGHAVAFPDVPVSHDLRLDAPAPIVLGKNNLNNVATWVADALAYWRQQEAREATLGREGIDQLIQLLSPSWELYTPLAAQFADEEQTMIRLTEEQFVILSLLNGQRRAAIAGCAGSGKTTLALEKAKRLAAQGFRVLLTCYNRDLAEYLGSDETLPSNVTVQHFHALCVRLVREAGLGDRLTGNWQSEEWYDQTLPNLLMEATDLLGPQYDAILVDEGQDFQSEWWIALLNLLEDPDHGIFYLFYDDNQALYQDAAALPLGLQSFPLSQNLRNTQHIHRAFLPFYRSTEPPNARGPEGRAPERHFYDSANALKDHLRRILHRLTVDEKISTEDIVVLTPRHRTKSVIWQWGRLGNLRLTDQWPPASGEVYATTVHSFKGLESPVIILAELEPSDRQDLETLLYVGCSRARNHLIILANESLSPEVREKLNV